jgi:TIR domain
LVSRSDHAAAARSSLSVPRATILRASSGNGRCNAWPHIPRRAHPDVAFFLRCKDDRHDLRIGDKFIDEIDTAIRIREKVVLVLSENSIKSVWVEDEVTTAYEEERKRGSA